MAVAVTLGSGGALLADSDGRTRLPVPSVEVIDATGAGDTFSGVLAAWLAEGRPIADAVRAANVAAAISVTRPGARGGMPDRARIVAALTA